MTEPTALQRFEYHVKAFAGVDATLQERIAANLELARKPWQSPHMRSYYVQVARWQNRQILSNRRRLVAMAQGAEIEPPRRKPYVPKPRRAPEQPFATLTPLEIALALDVTPHELAAAEAIIVEQKAALDRLMAPSEVMPWPNDELVQGALF